MTTTTRTTAPPVWRSLEELDIAQPLWSAALRLAVVRRHLARTTRLSRSDVDELREIHTLLNRAMGWNPPTR